MTADAQLGNGVKGQPAPLQSPEELAGRLVESIAGAMDL